MLWLRRSALILAPVLSVLAAPGCKRPVTGRDFEGATLMDLQVHPENVRQGVPISVRFRLAGGPQGAVTLTIAGKSSECAPATLADGSFECVHPGVSRQEYPQGGVDLLVQAKDRVGKESQLSGRLTIDFECPQFLQLSVSPAVGAPGSSATLEIEASELLGEPPLVSRGGVLWETPQGSGTSWTLAHQVTERDAEVSGDVVVRIADLAGNSSGDCGIDARVSFGVDRLPPVVDAQKIEIVRGISPAPTRIRAEAGAFSDDVGIQEVRVMELDPTGSERVVATVHPDATGALEETSLGVTTQGRVRIEAFDVGAHGSGPVWVNELWTLSVGTGEAPKAAIRTGDRYSPPPPGSHAMANRTRELAMSIVATDNQSAALTSAVGFRPVGSLPSTHRDIDRIIAGYDTAGGAVLAFGGRGRGLVTPLDQTMVIRWDELSAQYQQETLALPLSPSPRAGTNLAFDGEGCGVLFGGEGDRGLLGDTWLLCGSGSSYAWQRLETPSSPSVRTTPILYDPVLRRWVITAGLKYESIFDYYSLDRASGATPWRWVRGGGLPRDLEYTDRFLHAFWYEPKLPGYAVALGYVFPFSVRLWQDIDGAWSYSLIPFELESRTGFGFAHDDARGTLVVWGHDTDMVAELDPDTWLLAGDPRDGPTAWRRVNLNPSIMRGNPTLVYDADRQTTLVLGGLRFTDLTTVPPVIEELLIPPVYPELLANIDLTARRPDGIAALRLNVGATGGGDGDGTGPGSNRAGGVRVMLYDHQAARWDEAANVITPEAGNPVLIPINVTDRPERYVSADAVVPVLVQPRWPATEDAEARLDVDVLSGELVLEPAVPDGARILDFSASLSTLRAGRTSTLSWVVEDAPDGIELYQGSTRLAGGLAAVGSYPVSPLATSSYRLVATNRAAGSSSRELTLTVLPAGAPPIILSFGPAELVGARGATLRFSWDVDRATSLRVLRGEAEVFNTTTRLPRGNVDVRVPAGTLTSTTYTLEAVGPSGVERRSVPIRLGNALVLHGPSANITWTGSLGVESPELFIVEMADGGYIQAEIFVPTAPQCVGPTDPYLYLRDSNLDSLGSDDSDGTNNCSRITAADSYSLVPRGVYYLEVQEYYEAAIPAFSLVVSTLPVICGNGVVEPGESCDDNNTNNGDGCSSTCAFEPVAVYTAPTDGTRVLAGAISVAGEVDVVRMDVLQSSLLSLQTFVPDVAAGCPGADTVLQVLADDMTTLVLEDDDSGDGSCSLISNYFPPGTYYLAIHEYRDDGTIPAYELRIEFPLQPALETEPNDTLAQAQPLGLIAPGSYSSTIAARITPVGDDDLYSFDLAVAASVTITTYGLPSDRTRCNGVDTEMWLYDAAQVELAYVDDATATCAIIDGIGGTDPGAANLAPGRYYLRVRDYQDDELIPSYFIDVGAL